MPLGRKQSAFLAAYALTGVLASAARAACVDRRRHYEWLGCPEYVAAFDQAEQEAIEDLEAEARRRAKDGVVKPILYQGALCFEPARDRETGEILRHPETGRMIMSDTPMVLHEYSDNLMMFLLKSKRPEKYRDNATVEHTGPGGAPLSIEVKFVEAQPRPSQPEPHDNSIRELRRDQAKIPDLGALR